MKNQNKTPEKPLNTVIDNIFTQAPGQPPKIFWSRPGLISNNSDTQKLIISITKIHFDGSDVLLFACSIVQKHLWTGH